MSTMIPLCMTILSVLTCLVSRDCVNARNFNGNEGDELVRPNNYITVDIGNLLHSWGYAFVVLPYASGNVTLILSQEPYKFHRVMHGDTRIYIADVDNGSTIQNIMVTKVDESELIAINVDNEILNFSMIEGSAVALTPREYNYKVSHISTPVAADINEMDGSSAIETSVAQLSTRTHASYRASTGCKIHKVVDNDATIWEAENPDEHCWTVDAVFVGDYRLIKVTVEGENYNKNKFYIGKHGEYKTASPTDYYNYMVSGTNTIDESFSVSQDEV